MQKATTMKVVLDSVDTLEEQALCCTLDWLFFSLWASSTTKQAHVTEPRTAWSIVMSS